MDGNIVKLVFQTVMAGSGFAKVNAETAELMKKMGKMSQGVQIMGRAFGNLGGIMGHSIGMLMQGGIWGAAAEVASAAVGKAVSLFREWNRLAKDAQLAAKGLSREYMTLEYAHAQYLKRVERWRKAADEARQAEEEAAAKSKEAAERLAESKRQAVVFAQRYYALEDKIAQEGEKAGLQSEKEVERLRAKVKLMLDAAKAEVADRTRGVETAQATGGGYDVDIARKELELAVARQKNVVAEARRLVSEHRSAKELAEAEAEARLEAMREEGERKAGEIRKAYAEAIARVEAQIAAKRAEADAWEANAQGARGVGFGDWARGERDRARDERDRARDERAEARKQANRERGVDDEIARIEAISPRARSKWHRNRLAQLKGWKAAQDPDNNPALDEADALEKKREKLLEEQNAKLDKIAELLQEAVSL